MKVKVQDLSKTLKNYSNKWVALKQDSLQVVGVGNKVEDVIKQAKSKGAENPILTRAPKDYGTYIL